MKHAFIIAVLVTAPFFAKAQQANPYTNNAAAIEEGRGLYSGACTQCHGPDGAAGEIGPGLAIPGRSYGRTSDSQIFDAVKQGIPATMMAAHMSKLSDDQIWKITAYVRGLRGTAIDAPYPGDVAHGEVIFWGKGGCGSCHMLRGRGSIIGPDLSNLASIRKTNSIIDALTKENHKVYGPGGAQPHSLMPLQMYPAVRVTTAADQKVRGVLRNEDSFSMQVMGLDQKLYLLDRSKLKTVVYESQSLMPTDYEKRLTKGELDDLVAFLTRLGSLPEKDRPQIQMPGGPDPD